MKKLKIKIIDNTGAPNNSPGHIDFEISKYIEWDFNVSPNEDLVFYTDKNLTKVNIEGHKKRIAWLVEPYIKQPHIYNWVSENNHLFDYVLVNEKTLLDRGENFIFYPFGGCWFEPKDRKFYKKSKLISIICSNKRNVPDHYKRHELIQRWGENIDVMGRGYAPIDNILDGLKDYKFHIAMENMKRDFHFSEKLINPIMAGTIPIYWGMPSIGDYFDTRGMIIMNDIEDFPKIYNELGEKLYKNMLPYAQINFEIAKQYSSPIENWMYENIFEKMGLKK